MSQAVTQAEFARLQGWAKSYVTALKGAGRLVMDPNGRVLVEESRARIAATADPNRDDVGQRHATEREGGAPAAPAPSQPDQIGSSYQTARAVKEKFLALSAKRDYELACGKLMVAEEVITAIADLAVTFRTRLEAGAPVLAASLAGHLDEAQRTAVIASFFEELLTDLSSGFARIAKAE